MSYGSGADLEYRNLLARAGVAAVDSEGHDGPLLFQKAKTREIDLHAAVDSGRLSESYLDARYKNVGEVVADNELPERLGVIQDDTHSYVANPNNITESGMYYTDGIVGFHYDGASPLFGGFAHILAFVYDTNEQSQIAFSAAAGIHLDQMARRQKSGGVWSSWKVIGPPHYDSGWVTLSVLPSTWSHSPTTPLQGRKIGNRVTLRGAVVDGDSWDSILNLPVGWIPPTVGGVYSFYAKVLCGNTATPNGMCNIYIWTDGGLTAGEGWSTYEGTAGNFVSFDNISFLVD